MMIIRMFLCMFMYPSFEIKTNISLFLPPTTKLSLILRQCDLFWLSDWHDLNKILEFCHGLDLIYAYIFQLYVVSLFKAACKKKLFRQKGHFCPPYFRRFRVEI